MRTVWTQLMISLCRLAFVAECWGESKSIEDLWLFVSSYLATIWENYKFPVNVYT